MPTDHPMTQKTGITVTDLQGENIVAHAGHGRSVMNNLLVSVCAEAGFAPRIRHEVAETSTLVTLVAAGLGIAVAPEPTAALDVAGVVYRPLIPDTIGVDLVAARATGNQTPLLDNVVELLRRIV